MTIEGLLVTLIIGGLVGWLASMFMRTNSQMGLLANIVVGIVGSALGAWLARVLGLGVRTTVGSWVVAVVGAMALIAILKGLRVYR
jgi:uncharacterized membrane protein YeaQ/YmgE (transglycosylase-associated protein family)